MAATEGLGSGPRAVARSVLLLDDEEAILVPTAAYFRALGFRVDTARESEEAGALVQNQRYDLAILDLRVSEYGVAEGLAVLREIRERDAGTSVVVLSAYVSPELEALARALGADEVLHKPQPLRALLAFAREHERHARGVAPASEAGGRG